MLTARNYISIKVNVDYLFSVGLRDVNVNSGDIEMHQYV